MEQLSFFVQERWDKIESLLDERGRVSVDELARLFSVSRSTVRRDLDMMEARHLIVRTRGGALRNHGATPASPSPSVADFTASVNEKLGLAAAQLVTPGETVMLGAGPITEHVVRGFHATRVVLVTNSISAACLAIKKPNIELILVGGLAGRCGDGTFGPAAEEIIHRFTADTAILEVSGVSADGGLTASSMLLAQVERAMIARSRRLIVVADHTKLCTTALCQVAPLSTVSALVTDSNATPEALAMVRSAGAQVVVAE